MQFQAAYDHMKSGYDVKLPEWGGFWRWENDTIMIYCRDGEVLDIRETKDVDFTVRFMFRADWELVE